MKIQISKKEEEIIKDKIDELVVTVMYYMMFGLLGCIFGLLMALDLLSKNT